MGIYKESILSQREIIIPTQPPQRNPKEIWELLTSVQKQTLFRMIVHTCRNMAALIVPAEE
jgi:membrane carboxypeptidase/penicillin-binding protein PbpC